MDEVNRELRELVEESHEEEARQAYAEYIDSMLHSFYEENFGDSGWDLV